ncbi:uncharacterized protein K452DRAFT_293845 [Aplosporella prunicola CBS 121167]|uniref:Uncharacterized protein n=1 Tax=Aplosporella prunicola CBS 121167 TaxID=1176127 RepID=A0A6A6BXF8_9PEZI|nr:uncharacterized protein K452DRAFT_293845 [Aplosporella prunicola CBS 121167]KAF2147421.1 hypothetical protein K452DRAFT_293845 [Aplosporella prunicola CBS 121167]
MAHRTNPSQSDATLQQHIRSASEASQEHRRNQERLMETIHSHTNGKDLPLRTMYILNCASRGQATSQPKPADRAHEQNFTSILQQEMSQLPLQRTSLPLVFVRKFVRDTFCQDQLSRVNFSQALTALDYFKDLEMRRINTVQEMWHRLGVDVRATPGGSLGELAHLIDLKERYLTEMYAWLYVYLRQWILIHEIKMQPFDKHNCLAMLNTLWPPIPTSIPEGIPPAVVQSQRKDFFKAINSIPGRGTVELQRLITQDAKEGEPDGWPETARMMDIYIEKVDEIIEFSEKMRNTADVDLHVAPPSASLNGYAINREPVLAPLYDLSAPDTCKEEYTVSRKGRKVDSGISFGSAFSKRPSTSGSTSSAGSVTRQDSTTPEVVENKRNSQSKMGRVLNKLHRKKTTPDLKLPDEPEQQPEEKRGSLRKMRSFGALASDFKHRSSSRSGMGSRQGSACEPFDAEEMKRHRMAYEAKTGKFLTVSEPF